MSEEALSVLDAKQLNSESLDANGGRNDLTVKVHSNLSSGEIVIHKAVDHGDLSSVTEKSNIKPGEDWNVDAHAKGVGSNIILNISMPNNSGWAIIAATPSNKENYFKVSHKKEGYKNISKARNSAEKKDKHYSTDPTYDETHNDYKATINITSESPAHCTIEFSDKK